MTRKALVLTPKKPIRSSTALLALTSPNATSNRSLDAIKNPIPVIPMPTKIYVPICMAVETVQFGSTLAHSSRWEMRWTYKSAITCRPFQMCSLHIAQNVIIIVVALAERGRALIPRRQRLLPTKNKTGPARVGAAVQHAVVDPDHRRRRRVAPITRHRHSMPQRVQRIHRRLRNSPLQIHLPWSEFMISK